MKTTVALLILFAAVVVFAGDNEKWINGAVKALITKQEMEAFNKLKTDGERDQFVKDFWAKRDPSPSTPENELKDQYDKRVQQINDLKIPSKKRQGADTDLGQTLLLLGPPTEKKKLEQKAHPTGGGEEEEGEEQAGPAGAAERQDWIYRNLPAEVASGEVQIEFVADPSAGEWKFADSKKAQALLEKAREQQMKMAQHAGQAEQAQQQQQHVQPPAVEEGIPLTTPALKAALDATAAGNAPKDFPFESIGDAFMTSKGELFGTVAINTTADATAAKVGIRVLDSAGAVVKEMELPFTNPAETAEYFQTRIAFTAGGDFTLLAAVANGEKAGAVKHTLKVPDPSQFTISSIILSKTFNPLPDAKPEGEPYTFGKMKVTPSLDHVFAKEDELTLIYEVYNFAANPTTGKPDLEATLTFTMGKSRPSQTYPITGEKHLVLGKRVLVPQGFPLQGFPTGTWTVNVSVKDKVTNNTVTKETQFTLK